MNERIRDLALDAIVKNIAVEAWVFTDDELEKFAELIVRDYAMSLVHANMNNAWYVQAMDEYYESKWAHRFD